MVQTKTKHSIHTIKSHLPTSRDISNIAEVLLYFYFFLASMTDWGTDIRVKFNIHNMHKNTITYVSDLP